MPKNTKILLSLALLLSLTAALLYSVCAIPALLYSIGLHPLVTIFALLIGGQLFGLVGMLLAVPISAIMQVFLRSLASYYRESEFYQGTP